MDALHPNCWTFFWIINNLYDNKKNVIAAIHAGWKGAFKGIIKKVINFMLKIGCKRTSITVAIGPCISQKNYEVKEDFKKKFLKKDKKNKKTSSGHPLRHVIPSSCKFVCFKSSFYFWSGFPFSFPFLLRKSYVIPYTVSLNKN